MNLNTSNLLFEKLEHDKTSAQNFIAQADSRYVLFNVNEPLDNFPKYTESLDDRLISIAYSYLSIGCTYAENQNIENAISALEKGARILELIYCPKQNRNNYSKYFILTSALAYYASCQYSKAFIILRDIEVDTDIAELFSYFLKREYKSLIGLINNILLNDVNSTESISNEIRDGFTADDKIQKVLLAKSLSFILEFIYSGEEGYLASAENILGDLLELLTINEDPSMWWVVRIFKVIIKGIFYSSLWNLIPPKIGDDPNNYVTRFVLCLAFQKTPVVELFITQRIALDQVLCESGAIVSSPTSSGKTRIAEMAILQCLIKNPDSIVLYLAPFRSLAYEIENTLYKTFFPLGFEVSHLYGGSQFSKIDKALIEESSIIIATPEKTKAILRSDPIITSRIKLVIIDEGHLLGATQRYITNELFLEELKVYIRKNEGRMILLSAVLPNEKEISNWITGNEKNAIISDWRPSSQRFGILEWTGKNVNIDWSGEIKTFNKSFIEPFKIYKPRSEFIFPSNKRQAIALVAVKLTALGSVLIFVGRKNMVIPQANDILTSFGNNPEPNKWINNDDWNSFELACKEAFGDSSDILNFAYYGIICHSGNVPTDVRLIMERLMRNGNPKIIISTSTLAQGVNIGPSSVIIANVWITADPIGNRDFWNIAGRAGRAFVDVEGKILFAIDKTTDRWRINRDLKLARNYFDTQNLERAESGLLILIKTIFNIAQKCNIDFDLLLQLISENDYSKFIIDGKNYKSEMADAFDWIDDTLLALNLEFGTLKSDDPSDWIDDVFKNSLAIIQSEFDSQIKTEEVISFLKARNSGVLKIAGNPNRWASFVSSGIPLRSIVSLEDQIDDIIDLLKTYNESSQSIDDLVILFGHIEKIIINLPSSTFSTFKTTYSEDEFERIRELWLAGVALNIINNESKNAQKICHDFYGYTLPWAINAISKALGSKGFDIESKQFEEFAVLSELGLPNFLAAKIYLAGIKSRTAATELAAYFNEDFGELSVRALGQILVDMSAEFIDHCTNDTSNWIKMLIKGKSSLKKEIRNIPNFKFKEDVKIDSKILNVRKFNDSYYLCSPDYQDKLQLKITDRFPFDQFVNDYSVYFSYDDNLGYWKMRVRNPILTIKS